MTDRIQHLNEVYDELAEQLNISQTMVDNAVNGYTAVGEWLSKNDQSITTDVYVQGSFALGTVVRPLSGNDDDYDIDLVCCLPQCAGAEAKDIKHFVGGRLRENGTYLEMLDPIEGKRCWTLVYNQFHMDILPCTLDTSSSSDTAIKLTNKISENYYKFRQSDPKAYKVWFEQCMGRGTAFEEARRCYATKLKCSIEKVPIILVRTPLQKAIQILKHHRNLMFDGKEDAPISIIITTLASLSYSGTSGTFDTLNEVLAKMNENIKVVDGQCVIKNPVSNENFADKWRLEPSKKQAYYRWHQQAVKDLIKTPLAATNTKTLGISLNESVGKVISSRTLDALGKKYADAGKVGELFASTSGLSTVLTSNVKPVPKHSFYGES